MLDAVTGMGSRRLEGRVGGRPISVDLRQGLAALTNDSLETESGVVRNARHNASIAWLRAPISVIVSGFLIVFANPAVWATWLGVVFAIEAAAWHVRTRVASGDLRYRIPHLAAIGAVSLAWIALAIILWFSGQEVARIAAVVTLFSVAMYGVAGGYKSAPILVVLVVPPLLSLFGILTSFAWSTLEVGPALLTTFATLASCVTIGFTAAALHRSDEGLEKANSELRALTQRLTLLAEKERVASQAKDVFLANVSHEIRTPLHGIIGLATTIDPARLADDDRESIAVIRGSGEMLERLISDLLDVAAIEAGRIQLNPSPIDPVALVRTAMLLTQGEAERKGLSMNFVPPVEAPGLLHADGVRIQQVVLNLLSNAIKYTQRGGVTVHLGHEPGEGDNGVRLRLGVSDTGEGFDLASHQKLFERFERGERAGSEPGSLGLGLAITHALVGAMGGEIKVNSRIGTGSTFEVTLPLQRLALGDVPNRSGAAPLSFPGLAGRERPLQVLLVEDHPVNRRVVMAVLEPLAAQVEVCLHGREAVEAAARARFDVILMDLLMPVMDGLEATRAIRRHEVEHALPRAAIIMMTASALPSQAEKAREAGCDAHLVKPVTPGQIYETLGRVLEASAPGGA